VDMFKARLAALDGVFGRHSNVYRESTTFVEGGPVAFAEFPRYLPKAVVYATCELTGRDEDGRWSRQLAHSGTGGAGGAGGGGGAGGAVEARTGNYEILLAVPVTSKLVPQHHQAGIKGHGIVGHILRDLARLSTEAELGGGAVVPLTEPFITPVEAALLVDISSSKHPFVHQGHEHGLMLAMFIHRPELDHCRRYGHKALIGLLRDSGCYPLSDHRRESVV
jgi:hypothetical protein